MIVMCFFYVPQIQNVCFLVLDKQFVDCENQMVFLVLVRVLSNTCKILSYIREEQK